jgi:hypothetical protein
MTMPRTAQVFRDGRLVLDVTDAPGVLLSTAPPPPGGAPTHPFVTGRAHDPYSEGELATILSGSDSYEDFLARLTDAGFEVTSSGP